MSMLTSFTTRLLARASVPNSSPFTRGSVSQHRSMSTLMKRWFPATSHPLVISAPMDFVTNARLATEVSKAGGLGFLQGGRTFHPESAVISKTLDEQLSSARKLLAEQTSHETHPLGVGFVTYDKSALEYFTETTVPILAKHKPEVVWLFAPSPDQPSTHRTIIASLRSAAEKAKPSGSWKLHIAVQVGTVEAARQAVEDGADIIVAQGTDAGGHQFASGAGIISLVPEIANMLSSLRSSNAGSENTADQREIALWAAGGIADGRGVAAALALGADAAVMGTKYMVATESDTLDYKRKAILNTSDGGRNTVKSYINDHVQGNHSWPTLYDGRAIIHPSHTDQLEKGLSLDENKELFKAAKERGDTSRMVTWSGTGVGLVLEQLPAAEITRQVRDDALKAISRLSKL